MRYAIMFCLLSAPGCATMVTGGGHSETVRLNSAPQGATVYVDGNRLGLTPIAATLTRKDNHTVIMSMDGFDDQTVAIRSGFNGWLVGNLLVGGVIGMVVDVASGAMEGDLSPGSVNCKFNGPPRPIADGSSDRR
jgi:hypothetical protein